MIRAILILRLAGLLASATAWGFTPYYTDNFSSINTTYWISMGSVGLPYSGGGMNVTSTSGASLISKVAVRRNAEHDVKATVTAGSPYGGNGGNYVILLRASPPPSTGRQVAEHTTQSSC